MLVSRVSRNLRGWSAHMRSIRWCMSEITWCGSECGKQRVASFYRRWGSFWVHVHALLKHELKRHIQDFFIIGIFCFVFLKKGTFSGLSILDSSDRRLHEIFERSQGLFQSQAHLRRGTRDALHQRGVQADHLSPRVVIHCRRNTKEWRNKREGGGRERSRTISIVEGDNQRNPFLPDRIPTCAWKQSRLSKHLEGN